MENKEIFDCAIVGAGPAGLTAAIFALRAGLKVVCFERLVAGGQVTLTSEVDNFPGFEKISGAELGQKFHAHAMACGMVSKFEEVLNIKLSGDVKEILTNKGTYYASTVILSMGAYARKLDLENETELQGRGISYCATCDGALFAGKKVAVVGGGNSAIEDAIYLTKHAEVVYLIHRRDAFRADEVTQREFNAAKKENGGRIVPVYNSYVTKLIANDKLKAIEVTDILTHKASVLDVDGLFVAIGRKPDTDIVSDQIEIDDKGYIVVNADMETKLAGVFAAGDVTNRKLKLIATAVGDGAIAADKARTYLVRKKAMEKAGKK